MKSLSLLCAGIALSGAAPSSDAHVLWINATPGSDGARTVMASIGYGDFMPGDETLTPEWGPTDIAAYDVISPDGNRSSLGIPKLKPAVARPLPSGIAWEEAGDPAMRKIVLGPKAAPGTYQVVARTPVVPVEQNRIEVNYMKTAFAVERWTPLEPVGHALEIIPLSDLQAARAGDVVRFKVLLNGHALTQYVVDYAFAAATSPGFGTRWSLLSELEDGEAEFRLPNGGAWRIDVRFGGPASAVKEFQSHPAGTHLWIESSFAFFLQP
jgi:hypothetical protein